MLGLLPAMAKACVFVLIALLAARGFLAVLKIPQADMTRWLIAWVALTLAAFMSAHFLVYVLTIACCCAILARLSPGRVPAIYIALLPVLPLFTYTLPGALGIKTVFDLDHFRALTLALLLPAVLFSRSDSSRKSPVVRNGVDLMFFAYCAWLVVLAWLQRPSLTDSARASFETVIFILVPYLAVSRLIRSEADMRRALLALVFTGMLVAFIGLMEERMRWYFYQSIPQLLNMTEPPTFANAQEVRFGFVRIRGSIDGGLGYFLVFALGAVIWLHRIKLITGWRFWMAILAMLLPIFFTGSRGTWIVGALMIAAMAVFPFIKTPARFVFVSAVTLLLIPTLRDFLAGAKDPFGTFDYRARLLESATPMVFEKPVFGWDSMQTLFATGRLEHLRQGQGIIDMVNSYLGEALFRGIPGLLLFGGFLLAALWAVLRRHHRGDANGRPFLPEMASFLASMVIATAFLLATISMVGHIPAYLYLLVALCSAYSALPDAADVEDSRIPAVQQPKVRRRPRGRPARQAVV